MLTHRCTQHASGQSPTAWGHTVREPGYTERASGPTHPLHVPPLVHVDGCLTHLVCVAPRATTYQLQYVASGCFPDANHDALLDYIPPADSGDRDQQRLSHRHPYTTYLYATCSRGVTPPLTSSAARHCGRSCQRGACQPSCNGCLRHDRADTARPTRVQPQWGSGTTRMN
jgi:hypothetical protein